MLSQQMVTWETAPSGLAHVYLYGQDMIGVTSAAGDRHDEQGSQSLTRLFPGSLVSTFSETKRNVNDRLSPRLSKIDQS